MSLVIESSEYLTKNQLQGENKVELDFLFFIDFSCQGTVQYINIQIYFHLCISLYQTKVFSVHTFG